MRPFGPGKEASAGGAANRSAVEANAVRIARRKQDSIDMVAPFERFVDDRYRANVWRSGRGVAGGGLRPNGGKPPFPRFVCRRAYWRQGCTTREVGPGVTFVNESTPR